MKNYEDSLYDWYGPAKPMPRARKDQTPPDGDWLTWFYVSGRGAGKTLAMAQWVRHQAEANTEARIAFVGRDWRDVKEIMIDGPSGILAVSPPSFMPTVKLSSRSLEWPNGAQATLIEACDPMRVRGKRFTDAWCEEVCDWDNGQAWDYLLYNMNGSPDPRIVATTTERPNPLVDKIVASSRTAVTRNDPPISGPLDKLMARIAEQSAKKT